MTSHVLYLVGGPPRVGKSALAQRLLKDEGIAWLPTQVFRQPVTAAEPPSHSTGHMVLQPAPIWRWSQSAAATRCPAEPVVAGPGLAPRQK
jgi:hypothetical protein